MGSIPGVTPPQPHVVPPRNMQAQVLQSQSPFALAPQPLLASLVSSPLGGSSPFGPATHTWPPSAPFVFGGGSGGSGPPANQPASQNKSQPAKAPGLWPPTPPANSNTVSTPAAPKSVTNLGDGQTQAPADSQTPDTVALLKEELATVDAVLSSLAGRVGASTERTRAEYLAKRNELRHSITSFKPLEEQIATLEAVHDQKTQSVATALEAVTRAQAQLHHAETDLAEFSVKLQKLYDQQDAEAAQQAAELANSGRSEPKSHTKLLQP